MSRKNGRFLSRLKNSIDLIKKNCFYRATNMNYYNQDGMSEPHVEPEVYNDLEEKSEVQLVRERCADTINKILGFIAFSKSEKVATWACIHATGASHTEGKGCSDRAAELNVTPQALSKQTREIADILGIEPVMGYDKKRN